MASGTGSDRMKSPDISQMKQDARRQTAHPRVIPGMLDAMYYYIKDRKPFREVLSRFGVPKKAFERYVKDEQDKLTSYLDLYKPKQRFDQFSVARQELEAPPAQYLTLWSDYMRGYAGGYHHAGDYGRGPPLLPQPGAGRYGSQGRMPVGGGYDNRYGQGDSRYAQRTAARFYMLGGMDQTLEDVCKILVHIRYPDVYRRIGTEPPHGILLHGPPGCGKTMLAHAIAGEVGLPLLKLAATEIVSGISGDSEKRIRQVFEEAVARAPTILFLDNLDAVCTNRESAQRGMEKRIITQLISSLDDLNQRRTVNVLVVAATSHPEMLDAALRRAGRFDHEVALGIPSKAGRESILSTICHNLHLPDDIDYAKIAEATPGFVGADLVALVKEAVGSSVQRAMVEHEKQHRVKALVDEVEYRKRQRARAKAEREARAKAKAEREARAKAKAEEEAKAKAEEEAKAKAKAEEEEKEGKAEGGEDESKGDEKSEEKKDVEMADASADKKPEAEVAASEQKDEKMEEGDKPEVAENGKDEKEEEEEEEEIEDVNPDSIPHADFVTVFRWMKDQRPMRDDQARNIIVQMGDFMEAVEKIVPSSLREGFITVPDVTWEDIGALKHVRDELALSVLTPVKHPKKFESLGLTRPAGILLAGPPGCGKTLVAKAIANECGINFISVKGPELLNMYVGESERAVRQLFQRARCSQPCVIFFDEMDALCPCRSKDFSESSVSARVVNQLLTEMDGFEGRENVYIIGATNRPDIIDPAVLRPGRLDKVLFIDLPTPEERLDILTTITKGGTKPTLAADVKLQHIALDSRCTNFSGADIAALVREASMTALSKYMEISTTGKADPTAQVTVTKQDFEVAFGKVTPSVLAKEQEMYAQMRSKYQTKSATAPSSARAQKRAATPVATTPTATATADTPPSAKGRRSGRKK